MAWDGVERASQAGRHILDEARFTAASWSFDKQGKLIVKSMLEQINLACNGSIVGKGTIGDNILGYFHFKLRVSFIS